MDITLLMNGTGAVNCDLELKGYFVNTKQQFNCNDELIRLVLGNYFAVLSQELDDKGFVTATRFNKRDDFNIKYLDSYKFKIF